MKKFLLTGIVFLTFLFSAQFDSLKAGGVYEGVAPGKSIIGVRIGLSRVVGSNITYDYALARVWKGTFTIGGQVGYMWNKKEWKNNLDFKLRTTYRFYVLVPEWEVYGGVGIGGWVGFHKKANDGNVSAAFILGTSYDFTRNIGVNLEFDFGNLQQAYINLGVNLRF